VSAKYRTKKEAMINVMKLVREIEGVTEELTATARVRRTPIETYTPAIGV
jgi:hypothetical protein